MKVYKFISNKIYKNHNDTISHPIIKVAITAISISICIMIISSSILNGFQQNITNKIIGFGNHIQLSKIQNNSTFNKPIEINKELERKILDIKNINKVYPFAYKTGIINNNDIYGAILKGVDINYDFTFIDQHLIKGDILNFIDTKNEIIISNFIAKKINATVNDNVTISFIDKIPRIKKFKIKGIYKTDLDEIDHNFIITNIESIQKINKWTKNQIAGYEIQINNFDLINETVNEIENIISFEMSANNITDIYPQIFDWLKLQDYNFVIILILMLIICIANIINCILIIAIDKIKFIGIIKTIGYNNNMINKIFFNISRKIIIKGLIVGNLAGIIICVMQKYTGIIKINPEVYYMDFIPVKINMSQILMINSITIIVSLLSIFISSMIITKLKTIKLINFN